MHARPRACKQSTDQLFMKSNRSQNASRHVHHFECAPYTSQLARFLTEGTYTELKHSSNISRQERSRGLLDFVHKRCQRIAISQLCKVGYVRQGSDREPLSMIEGYQHTWQMYMSRLIEVECLKEASPLLNHRLHQ